MLSSKISLLNKEIFTMKSQWQTKITSDQFSSENSEDFERKVKTDRTLLLPNN